MIHHDGRMMIGRVAPTAADRSQCSAHQRPFDDRRQALINRAIIDGDSGQSVEAVAA